jgi:hypothetical protein
MKRAKNKINNHSIHNNRILHKDQTIVKLMSTLWTELHLIWMKYITNKNSRIFNF